jgi:ATP-dependent DNA helicase RecQ
MQDLHAILKHYWGYEAFRPVQEEAIRAVLAGHDTLLLLPTGGGKSVCFQVPTLAQEGLCIVVTPLIALMKDQVEQLKRRGISAVAIHSGMNRHEIDIALDNCVHGQTKFLYVSPERLRTDLLIERVKRMKVALLAVDEAHCISAWGYHFRPSYLLIAEFRERIPGVPVMAVTATATAEVRTDIQDKLRMQRPLVFQQSFARANLSYSVFYEEAKERKLLQILQNVPGTALVYVRTRKRTEQVADWLRRQGVSAAHYHAGLPYKERTTRQADWLHNRTRVIVATNAFGMGIDKPDVRAVVHLDLPDNLEAYYQEAGRAGRDGLKSYAVALYHHKDLDELREAVERKYPPLDTLRRVYQALANYLRLPVGTGQWEPYSFDLHAFAGTFGLPMQEVHFSLKLLEEEGFLTLNETFFEPSKLHFQVDHRELYDFQLRHPSYDAFIKLLLRVYGGELFTDFVRIAETELAQLSYSSRKEIEQQLAFLQERQIIQYEKQRDTPQLTLLTPRFEASLLPLNPYEILQRKKRDSDKVETVIAYASATQACRSILLLRYFDETTGLPCGQCDHCLKQKKQQRPSLDEQLLAYLRTQPTAPKALAAYFGHIPEEQLLDTLRQLLQNETLGYTTEGQLFVR